MTLPYLKFHNGGLMGVLAPIFYYSHLLTMTERKYSTHKKECLAIVFGCEKCRTCLEHKEFELHFVLVNEEG